MCTSPSLVITDTRGIFVFHFPLGAGPQMVIPVVQLVEVVRTVAIMGLSKVTMTCRGYDTTTKSPHVARKEPHGLVSSTYTIETPSFPTFVEYKLGLYKIYTASHSLPISKNRRDVVHSSYNTLVNPPPIPKFNMGTSTKMAGCTQEEFLNSKLSPSRDCHPFQSQSHHHLYELHFLQYHIFPFLPPRSPKLAWLPFLTVSIYAVFMFHLRHKIYSPLTTPPLGLHK